jgi:hypothetical protein
MLFDVNGKAIVCHTPYFTRYKNPTDDNTNTNVELPSKRKNKNSKLGVHWADYHCTCESKLGVQTILHMGRVI